MDHIFLPFVDFLWASTFVSPGAIVLGLSGVMTVAIKCLAIKFGIYRPKPCPDRYIMVGKLLLETTLAMSIHSISQDNIATFVFPELPYANDECTYCVANFEVQVDLTKKKMVASTLGDEHLSPSETMTLLLFHIITAHHVKLHSMGNWALNTHPSHKVKNSFHARNSIVTVMYNYMGFTSFDKYVPLWSKLGILSKEWKNNTARQYFVHGIEEGVRSHPQVRKLFEHSQFVHFVTLTRSIFLEEFAKHKSSFPGCDGEAMFVGTVLHSLDHLMYERILEDPFWVDVNCKRFGKMAEMVRLVRSGFVPDIPGVYFHKRFKGSNHPFYEAVYEKAAKINKDLADNMDTCIVK